MRVGSGGKGRLGGMLEGGSPVARAEHESCEKPEGVMLGVETNRLRTKEEGMGRGEARI